LVTRRLRIRARYRATIDEDQLALAFLMLAKSLREAEQSGTETTAVPERAARKKPR
jgi:hypothetical protein